MDHEAEIRSLSELLRKLIEAKNKLKDNIKAVRAKIDEHHRALIKELEEEANAHQRSD